MFVIKNSVKRLLQKLEMVVQRDENLNFIVGCLCAS